MQTDRRIKIGEDIIWDAYVKAREVGRNIPLGTREFNMIMNRKVRVSRGISREILEELLRRGKAKIVKGRIIIV